MRIVLGILVLLGLLGGVGAQTCAGPYRTVNATPHYQQGGDYQQPHFRKRVVNIVADVAQINPAYISSYSPDGYDSATQADILVLLRQVTARLEAQDKALAAMAARVAAAPAPAAPAPVMPPAADHPPPMPMPPTPPGPASGRPMSGGGQAGLALANAKCAQCHQAGKLAPDQRFTLLDAKGNLAQLTDRQKLKVMMKCYREEMPPPKNIYGVTALTDAEYAALVDLLSGN